MNQDFADISVIIPAYNRAELIGETLRSLLNQTVPAAEIIVVDDGSTDGTAEAVLRFAAENGCLIADSGGSDSKAEPVLAGAGREDCQRQPRGQDERERMSQKLKISDGKPWPEFKVIRQENAGPGAARNRGMAEATGEFIHFFDSDDIAALNKHEVQLRVLLETGADIAYGPWVKGRFVENERPMTDSGPVEYASHSTGERELMAERRVAPKIGGTTDDSDIHGYQRNQHGYAWTSQAGAAFSNPSTSELARDSENTSLTRSASGPAEALRADNAKIGSAGANQLADSIELLEGQSQAGLQMDSQKLQSIREANDPSTSKGNSSSVPIREIRGLSSDALDAAPLNFVPEGPVLQARGLPEGDLVRALLTNWSVVPHACLFRRSTLEKAGGFPEDIWVGEDQLLFLRCLLAGAKVVHTPGTLVFYRLGDDPGKLTATGAAQKRHARDWARYLLKANAEVAGGDKPFTRYSLPVTSPPSARAENSENSVNSVKNSFGFRLRAYESWRDLERFFPSEETELKNLLLSLWKRSCFSGFRFRLAGFLLRKLGGLKLRMVGYRERASFRCGRPSEVGLPTHESQRR